MYEIVNPDSLFYSKNSKLVNDFMDFSSKNLGFSKPVTIDFIEDDGAGQDPLGKTAHYNPQEMSIAVYTTNRHPKDILRSLSHELVHHCQNCEERIPSDSSTEEGYAQTDEAMRSLESEAYQKGNIMNFRDFEDQYKMKKNKKQINELTAFEKRLAQARGLNPRDIEKSDDVYDDEIVAKKRAEREKLAKDLKVAPGQVADLDLPALRQRRDSFRAATGSDPAPAPTPKPSPPKPKRRRPSGPHIERLQQALQDFGMRLKADGIFGRNTQAAINRVRSNWPTAPKRQSNFNNSVKALTDWLEANKNTGRKVKPAPAKGPAPSSGSTNTALAKSADLSKEYDQLIADRRRIDGMAPGPLKREAERQHKAQLADFKKKRAAARSGGVSEIIDPAFDEAEVSQKDKKSPLRENKKADRSEMLSRILTQRLLGNVKIKIKNN